MCGIAGLLDPRRATSADELTRIAEAMSTSLLHRGPDDSGSWVDPTAGIALGHRRLSIMDLSPRGRQPMPSSDGRFLLSFNGEIYNHGELRRRLEAAGVRFSGRSDTEVLVEAVRCWGIRRTLAELNGMFAFAVWDRHERRLTLARDRLGEKPLFHGRVGPFVVFTSELRALRAVPGFEGKVDPGAVALFLRHNNVPAPHSIVQGIQKLLPGHLLEIDAEGNGDVPEPYWSLPEVARVGLADPLAGGADELLSQVRDLVEDAVGLRMVADVPVGAFLSGGVDSSLVVAMMQARASRPVRTFTIGFEAEAYDESAAARAVAKHLATDHVEVRLSGHDVIDLVPSMPTVYDEPFADSSQLATYLVSRLARQQVTVSLSGDGGDELFAGYARYELFRSTWARMARFPVPVRRAAAAVVRRRSATAWNRDVERLGGLVPRAVRQSRPGDKLHKLARIAAMDDAQAAYGVLLSQWQDPLEVVRTSHEPRSVVSTGQAWLSDAPLVRRAQAVDQSTYLPDDILTKVDRASMAVSLEVRVPLLDHRLVELSWRLPTEVLYADGRGKWPLRALLAEQVPTELFDRPKQGFAVPIADWLRGPLRGWAGDLVATDHLDGMLDLAVVRGLWDEHLRRKGDWAGAYDLWGVLMLQAWATSWA